MVSLHYLMMWHKANDREPSAALLSMCSNLPAKIVEVTGQEAAMLGMTTSVKQENALIVDETHFALSQLPIAAANARSFVIHFDYIIYHAHIKSFVSFLCFCLHTSDEYASERLCAFRRSRIG